MMGWQEAKDSIGKFPEDQYEVARHAAREVFEQGKDVPYEEIAGVHNSAKEAASSAVDTAIYIEEQSASNIFEVEIWFNQTQESFQGKTRNEILVGFYWLGKFYYSCDNITRACFLYGTGLAGYTVFL